MKKIINLNTGKRTIGLGIFAVFLGMCVAGAGSTWYKKISQSKKKIEQFKGTHSEPVELIEIRNKDDKPLALSKQFAGEDEWLKGLEFKVKNVFTKDIIYIELYLDFPETRTTGNMMSYPLHFGKLPLTNEIEDVPVLKPDEETKVKVDEQIYSRLSQFLGMRHSVASLTLLRVGIGLVVFSDHTGWQAGNYYVQDPANPRHFINVGEALPNSSSRLMSRMDH